MAYTKEELKQLLKNLISSQFNINPQDWLTENYQNADLALGVISEAINRHIIQENLLSSDNSNFIVEKNLQVNQNTNLQGNLTTNGNTYLQNLFLKNNQITNFKIIEVQTDTSGSGSYNIGSGFNFVLLIPVNLDASNRFNIDNAKVYYNSPNIILEGTINSTYKVLCFYV